MSNLISAIRQDGNKTRRSVFSPVVWAAMGPNKNGWRKVLAGAPEVSPELKGAGPDGTASLEDKAVETEYTAIMAQAKGLDRDGDHAGALAKYKKALSLRESAWLKGQITKTENALKDIETEENRAELISMGDDFNMVGDLENAAASYESANELGQSDELTAKIKEIKRAQEKDGEETE